MTDPYAAPSQPNPGAGRIALTFGVVVIVITVAQQVFNRFIPLLMVQLSLDSGAIGGIFAIASIVIGIVALVAVIFGWLAVQRRGADAVIGGIGLGIGGSALINVIFAFVSAPVVSLWLS
ncbi:MAG: hypothetical protein ABJB03_10655 [Rhodoglobus sp.]